MAVWAKDALGRGRRDAALDVVGCRDEVGLRRSGPLVGELPGGVFHDAEILHAQGGELADRSPGFKCSLDRGL